MARVRWRNFDGNSGAYSAVHNNPQTYGVCAAVAQAWCAGDPCYHSTGPDEDGDGVGDGEDCQPQDPGVFRIPAEVPGVHFLADGISLEWESAAPEAGAATVYDVVWGPQTDLPVGFDPLETCLASGLASSIVVVPEVPQVGMIDWYVVRGRNTCGDGSYGRDSSGAPRESWACP